MKAKTIISLAVTVVAFAGTSCSKPISIEQTPYGQTTYKVVAHRGGASQSGAPENSMQGLSYARNIGCLAAECDIVATATDTVVVYHPADGTLNKQVPYNSTYAQLSKGFKLANNEKLPIFQDFVEFLVDKTKNPRGMVLWIDVKAWSDLKYSIKAIDNAYAVVKKYNAYDYCQFMIPTNSAFFEKVQDTDMFKEHKCRVAFMADSSSELREPSYYKKLGVWLQAKHTAFYSGVTPPYSPQDYLDAGVELSIWNCSSEGSEASFLDKVLTYYDNPGFRAVFVNYAYSAIKKIKSDNYQTY